jgi:hypothetical protein
VCGQEIEVGAGLRCTVCSDFDMCSRCHAEGRTHEHPLLVRAHIVNHLQVLLSPRVRMASRMHEWRGTWLQSLQSRCCAVTSASDTQLQQQRLSPTDKKSALASCSAVCCSIF